jgi:hypothetical protein
MGLPEPDLKHANMLQRSRQEGRFFSCSIILISDEKVSCIISEGTSNPRTNWGSEWTAFYEMRELVATPAFCSEVPSPYFPAELIAGEEASVDQ